MGPSICPLCLKAEENVDHLFVYCDFAQLLWTKVLSAFNISIQEPSSFGQFCLSAMKTIVSPPLLSLWRFVFVNGVWSIWNSRNKCIFENTRPSIWQSTAALWADLREIYQLQIGHMNNSQEDLLRLRSLHLNGHPKKAPTILQVQWQKP